MWIKSADESALRNTSDRARDGGLKDTVVPYNEFDKTGTGFSFANYNAHEMMDIIRYAEHIYYDKKRDWNKIVEHAMRRIFPGIILQNSMSSCTMI